MTKLIAYKLNDIADWHQKPTLSNIKLPSLQRGFVWKPYQIEDLWDSILRGYPIGAIMMSRNSQNKEAFLLDGQQRCTSIALGFNNPFDKEIPKDFLSLKEYLPSVWIDLKPDFSNQNRKFGVRVLTKSHPWGYQLNDNRSTLTMNDRKQALNYFYSKEKIDKYIDFKPQNINPWDSHYPVPLIYLLEELLTDEKTFIKNFRKKVANLKVVTKHSKGLPVDYNELTDNNFTEHYNAMLRTKKLYIPEIVVNAEILKDDTDEINEAQDPTLFVRLNSAGTNLNGEELIYSIYKAAFPETKNMVENIGASYLAPSKVINLFSRLADCELNDYKIFPRENTITSFRKNIKEVDYSNKLQEYIGTNDNCEAQRLIELSIFILSQSNTFTIPIIIKHLVSSNLNVFLLLLIYLKRYNLNKEKITTETAKDISSAYMHILWFGWDYKKIPHGMIENLSKNEKPFKWSEALKLLSQQNLLLPVIEPSKLREDLLNIVVTKKVEFDHIQTILRRNLLPEDTKNLFATTEEAAMERWVNFIWRIYHNRVMLLFAQRDYIALKFKDYNQFDSIEDTNRPWDWDHIYPYSWVYNKSNINPLVRRWVNSNGNLRALSFDDNRSENDRHSPADRLKDDIKKEESFILDNDLFFWNRLNQDANRIKANDSKSPLTSFLNAVINRNVNIYEEWYNKYYKI